MCTVQLAQFRIPLLFFLWLYCYFCVRLCTVGLFALLYIVPLFFSGWELHSMKRREEKKTKKKNSSLARASCMVVSLQILIYILILVNKQTTKKKKIQSSKRRRQAILRALTPSGHDISREPSSLKPCAFASFRTEGKKLGFSSEGGGRRVRCSSS